MNHLQAILWAAPFLSVSTAVALDIESVRWGPVKKIGPYRAGDNWCMTWADDDWQYASLCDGRGWNGVEKNQEVVRIRGDADSWTAEHLANYPDYGNPRGAGNFEGFCIILFSYIRNGTQQIRCNDSAGNVWSNGIGFIVPLGDGSFFSKFKHGTVSFQKKLTEWDFSVVIKWIFSILLSR